MANTFTTTTASSPAASTGSRYETAKLVVVTPPTAAVVEWHEAVDHLRLSDDATEQTYLQFLIGAATDYAETRLGMSLRQQTLRATFYDGKPLILPRGPVMEIHSVVDADDTTISAYELVNIGRKTRVVPTVSATYPISVTYDAGHWPGDAIPASIRLAILTHVGTLYQNRESVSDKAKLPVPHSLDAFYGLKSHNVGIG